MAMDLHSSDATLILNTVNANVGTFGVVTVNAKGLVTAARQLTGEDVVSALGFTPHDAKNCEHFVTDEQFPLLSEPNGATTLPNGLIFQWGTVTFDSVPSMPPDVTVVDAEPITYFHHGAVPVVTFPIPFPNTPFSCTGTGLNDDQFTEGCEMNVGIVNISPEKVQFSVGRVIGFNASDLPESGKIMWMAIGH